MAYGRLVKFAGKKRDCYPSLSRLAAELDVSPDQVNRYVRELIAHGLISRERRGTGRGEPYHYRFLWHGVFDGTGRLRPGRKKGARTPPKEQIKGGSNAPNREASKGGNAAPRKGAPMRQERGQRCPPNVSQSMKINECRSPNGQDEDFGDTNRLIDDDVPLRSLRSRVTGRDTERLADYITRTGRRCDERFAGEIVEAAPRAPSVEALIELFKEKTASGHGPRKHSSCGWFKKVAEDHFGDPERQGIPFKSSNPLTGIPTDPEEFRKYVERGAR